MQLWRGELSTNSHRQRLATRGFATALCRLFFRIYCAQNNSTKKPAVNAVREKLRFSRYEKAFTNLDHSRGDSGRTGWLRPDKEAGGAAEGGAGRCAFRQTRLSHAVPRRAVHAADHV